MSLSCLLVTSASVNVANADTITFTYSVSGDANVSFVFPTLVYSFVPDATVLTPLGSLDVRYEGILDFSLVPPSGPTTATWDFGPLGLFTGSGLQFSGLPDVNGVALFDGTSVITAGTGIFASASGFTSYTGSADLLSNTASFTEQIEITAPGLTVVPEPASVFLIGTGLAGLVSTRYRGRRQGRTTLFARRRA